MLCGDTRPVGTGVSNAGRLDRSGHMLSAQFNGQSGFGVQGNVTFFDGDSKAPYTAGAVSTLPFAGLTDEINTAYDGDLVYPAEVEQIGARNILVLNADGLTSNVAAL